MKWQKNLKILQVKKRKTGRLNKNSKKEQLSLEQLTELYESMLLIRRFEEKAGQLYGMGQIGGVLPFIYRARSCCCGYAIHCWPRRQCGYVLP